MRDAVRRRRRRMLWWLGGSVLGAVFVWLVVTAVTVVTLLADQVGHGLPGPGSATAPPMLADRGAAATIGVLRSVDACGLVDPEALSPGDPVGPSIGRDRPHACEVGASGGKVTVEVGTSFSDRARWYAEPIVVGGVKAYRTRPAASDRWNGYCEIDLPVTFTLAVRFRVQYADGPDMCRTAERVAAAAVPRLQDPAPRTVRAPLADVDPCALLTAAGPFHPGDARPDDGTLGSGIDGCVVSPEGRSVTLSIEYGDMPSSQVCGGTVPVPGVDVGDGSAAMLRVDDHDCPRGEAIANRALAALDDARAAPAVRPVRLYGPDEPDVAKTGDGVNQMFDCLLPGPVAIPRDADDLLEAAQYDSSFACRAAEDSVRRVFGSSLRPTVYGDYCHFVDDRHELDVGVAMAAAFDVREYGNSGRYDASEDGEVDGHETRYRESVQPIGRLYDWTVSAQPGPAPDTDGPGRGVVTVAVSHTPPRGVELGGDPLPLDPAVRDRGRALVADLLATRFSET